MIAIDQYAYINRLSHVPAAQKALLAIGALLTVTITRDIAIACWTIAVMSVLIVGMARIPVSVYSKLLIAPLGFSVTGVIAIVLSFSTAPAMPVDVIWYHSIGNWNIFIMASDVKRAITILFTASGAITSLYFLILTTPVYELSQLLQKLHVPAILIELIELTYRFIFLFLSCAQQLYTAQQARLGYTGIKVSFRSLSSLIVAMLHSLLVRNEQLTLAMHARTIDCFIVPMTFCEHKQWNKQMLWILVLYGSSIIGIMCL
ncbi:cobalt ECF transporter T component CbiQ [Lysinibacillus sp. LZ02]|uniref:cobalt ECF transporter T component CbiQ n=1 Tax=Lysinibacillus sp. LZ02 TaxID=3420668 RepID=UPI003D36F7B8